MNLGNSADVPFITKVLIPIEVMKDNRLLNALSLIGGTGKLYQIPLAGGTFTANAKYVNESSSEVTANLIIRIIRNDKLIDGVYVQKTFTPNEIYNLSKEIVIPNSTDYNNYEIKAFT